MKSHLNRSQQLKTRSMMIHIEMKKIILDLCGGTGAWSKPYKDAGYEVYNITLPEYDICFIDPAFHFQKLGDIYGILAAPPCTMFSLARTRAKEPRDFAKGMEVVKACLNIIWYYRQKQRLAFWALENPMGYLRQFLGRPPLTFNPCDYGDPYTKKTDLWGFYNQPKKNPVEPIYIKDSVRGKRYSPIHFHTGHSKKSAELRAITPTGFAKAFYLANT